MGALGAESGWLEATGNIEGFEPGRVMIVHTLQRFFNREELEGEPAI